MTQKNTPLILQLLKSVSEQPEFEANKEKGEITKKEIVELRKGLKKNPEFEEQSGRLRSSAESFVKEVYSSWLTLYQKRKRQKEGKEYFLENILKSDVELVGESNCDLETIRSKAQEVLTQPEEFIKQLTINDEDVKPTKSARKRVNKNIYNKSTDAEQREDSSSPNNVDENKLETLTNVLYKIHKQTQDILTRCAVAYLIKNHNKISELEEDVQKLKKRRNEKKVEIKRLENQIQDNRLPSGRDKLLRI
ncbi:type V CRISPR-associated protein Cas12k [Nostoc sp. 'Peltigera membranacea cyanobiont' 232]|uniref:type V CRISPR-associated protein Cas12k n=1 Tax=Nostoc sp. 'Peltigera membranacea cyanobiont' 232 TaxID=2014531 RepID=UPI000B95870C|nr:type V CRISPR-associated protein Cas12k [Nostoc sp. 'Peltigera membranacea cyanobiont' 232]OYE04438.1 hypothetical protein CDG79_13335 [Nostoc sp. 'Peltigera membranacea cyanobiont' 232]